MLRCGTVFWKPPVWLHTWAVSLAGPLRWKGLRLVMVTQVWHCRHIGNERTACRLCHRALGTLTADMPPNGILSVVSGEAVARLSSALPTAAHRSWTVIASVSTTASNSTHLNGYLAEFGPQSPRGGLLPQNVPSCSSCSWAGLRTARASRLPCLPSTFSASGAHRC